MKPELFRFQSRPGPFWVKVAGGENPQCEMRRESFSICGK